MAGAYAYPEPFYAPGWREPRPRTDRVAVAALVTGLLGLGPVAVVLGVVGLRRTRPAGSPGSHGTRGRGLAVAGTVLGVIGTLAWAALVAVGVGTAAASRPLPADVTEPTDARAVQLVTGSCLAALPPDGVVDRVRVVPCAEQHAAQVVTAYGFPAAGSWPGTAEVTARVHAACTLTPEEQEQGLRMVAWAPTEASWARGDRTGLCLAVPPEPVTGSLVP